MTAYTIKINGVKVKPTLDGLTDVVKEIHWTMQGELEGATFELPQTTVLADPEAGSFIAFADLTEETLKTWSENTETERIPSIKAHIDFVLEREAKSKQLSDKTLPWVPAVPEPTTPETPAE